MIVIATFVAGYGLNYSFGAEANLSAWMRKNTPMSVFGISGIVIAFWLGFALSGLKALQHEKKTGKINSLREEHGNLYDLLDMWMNVPEVRRIRETYVQSDFTGLGEEKDL